MKCVKKLLYFNQSRSKPLDKLATFLYYNIELIAYGVLTQLVECHLDVVEVIGSNPIYPTKYEISPYTGLFHITLPKKGGI